MKPSMLDTDVLSEFLRGNSKVKSKVEVHLNEFGFVSLSVITYYEILNGLLYKDAFKQLGRFEEFVGLSKVLPLTMPSAKSAASVYVELKKRGNEIGHTDTLIAGIALTNGLQLITNSTRHFERIDVLEIDNWTK